MERELTTCNINFIMIINTYVLDHFWLAFLRAQDVRFEYGFEKASIH